MPACACDGLGMRKETIRVYFPFSSSVQSGHEIEWSLETANEATVLISTALYHHNYEAVLQPMSVPRPSPIECGNFFMIFVFLDGHWLRNYIISM